MDECPHCGEPLDDSAESCPHCGSDMETGWKPDTDYYAVDLPEDDPAFSEPAPRSPIQFQWESVAGLALVIVAAAAFLAVGAATYRVGILLPALLLGLCGWFYYRWLHQASRRL